MAVRETAASHSKCLGTRLVVVALLGGWNLLLVCGLLVRHLARVNQCYVEHYPSAAAQLGSCKWLGHTTNRLVRMSLQPASMIAN